MNQNPEISVMVGMIYIVTIIITINIVSIINML